VVLGKGFDWGVCDWDGMGYLAFIVMVEWGGIDRIYQDEGYDGNSRIHTIRLLEISFEGTCLPHAVEQ